MAKYLFLIAILISNVSFAQIRLYGKITDHKNAPINMATIVLRDSIGNYITGCVSDSLGEYFLDNLKQGKYTLQFSFLGYQKHTFQLQTSIDVCHNVKLNPIVSAIDEVVIRHNPPLIQREIDRVVFHVDKLNTVATNCIDVLKQTPGILVQDDNIYMLNKGKIVFLLNGREINMDTKGLIAYLSTLSADNLKQIEIMTTPPAKYTSESSAGVINIVSKKSRNNYISGSILNQLSVS